jgi:hypothetical protein
MLEKYEEPKHSCNLVKFKVGFKEPNELMKCDHLSA